MSICNAIGIDLGTSYSRVAVYRYGEPIIISNKYNQFLTPSVVAAADNYYVVGEDALDESKYPRGNIIFNSKRLIGRHINDEKIKYEREYLPFNLKQIESNLTIEINPTFKSVHPSQISQCLLFEMKTVAEKYLNNKVETAVITVPASFNDLQRQLTIDAGVKAGFGRVELVVETTAVAIAYCRRKMLRSSRRLFILQLGGGTFDVSIVKVASGKLPEVEGTINNSHLGGIDFDQKLMKCFADKLKNLPNKANMRNDLYKNLSFRKACENYKISLLNNSQRKVELSLFGTIRTVTVEELEKECRDLFLEIETSIERVFALSKIKKNQIDHVLVVGGSTQIRIIQKLLRKFFTKEVEMLENEPAVCGAAVCAAEILTSQTSIYYNPTPIEEPKRDYNLRSREVLNDPVTHFSTGETSSPGISLKDTSDTSSRKGISYTLSQGKSDEVPKNLKESDIHTSVPSDTVHRSITSSAYHDQTRYDPTGNLGRKMSEEVLDASYSTALVHQYVKPVSKLSLDETSTYRSSSKIPSREAPSVPNKPRIPLKPDFSTSADRPKVSPRKMIGIDLGTSFSRVAVHHEGKIDVLFNERSKRITPSTVKFTEQEVLVGDQGGLKVNNTIFNVKKVIGKPFNDPVVESDLKYSSFCTEEHKNETGYKVDFRDQLISPEEISSFVIRKMKEIAEKYLDADEMTDAVITVPSTFNENQRQATIDAATIAGLKTVELIDSTTASAIAFCIENDVKSPRNMLILSFGGGFLEVAIITVTGLNIEVKARAENNHVGGTEFDKQLMRYFIKKFEKKNPSKILASNKKALYKLRTACVGVKHKLSLLTEAEIDIESLFDGEDLVENITRDKFEKICEHLFDEMLETVKRCFENAKINKECIDDILLVGGSTLIPKVQTIVKEFFKEKEFNHSVNIDEACVYGAAARAANLSGESDNIIGSLHIENLPTMKNNFEPKTRRLTSLQIEKIIERENKMIMKTDDYHKLMDAKNDLDAYILSTLKKLKTCEMTSTIRTAIEECEKVSHWMSQLKSDPKIEELERNLKWLKDICDPMFKVKSVFCKSF